MECPICYEELVVNVNCVVTECGHHFHCSCLMKNAAVNGFGCPFCRTQMAEKVEEEEEEEGEDEEEDEDDDYEEDDDSDFTDDIRQSFDGKEAFVLRGLRWLFAQNDLQQEVLEEVAVTTAVATATEVVVGEDEGHNWIDEILNDNANEDEDDDPYWEEAELDEEEEWARTEYQEEISDKKIESWSKKFNEYKMLSYDDLLKAYLYSNFQNSFDYLKFQKINKRIDKILKKEMVEGGDVSLLMRDNVVEA